VINQERPTQIEKKDTYYNLYVNNISLKDYKRLKGKKSKLRFEFNFEKNTINYFIDAKYEPTSIPSDDNLVNLFMDMGSTYTKYIVAQSNMNGDILKMRRCIGPKPTSTYCESISVDFNKKERVAAGTEAFGQWLVQSLRKISQEHHKRGEIIHSVIWSFPDIDGTLDQDFYLKASNIVNSHTNAFIYDKFMLIPEHESLKSMFDHILKTLAKVGRNEIDLIKQKNTVNRNKYNNSLHRYREYNNKWWLTKLFIEKVYDPGKLKQITIPEYYRKYLKMGCVDGLKNFIILDAGGYSLDVYGEIGTEFIKKSFETGGQQLTQQLEEVMLSENNDNDAEQEKIRSCQHGACREYSENCKKWTIEIYQPCIDKIYKFISDNLKKSSAEGVSMVLTGQAFKNIYLHDFVIEKLNKYTIGSQTSSNISNVIKSNTELLEDTYLSLFYSITCKNEPQNLNPKNDLDIAGGSLFRHLELHKEFVL